MVDSNYGIIQYCTSENSNTNICDYNGANGKIVGCINYSDIYFDGDGGGIVNDNYGTIEECTNYGNISGSNMIGGIAYYASSCEYKGEIKRCTNYGEVSSSDLSAGICAKLYSTKISECINAGKISGLYTYGMAYCCAGVTTTTQCINTGNVGFGSGYVMTDCDYNAYLVQGCTYRYKIRAYVDFKGNRYYGKYSSEKTITLGY